MVKRLSQRSILMEKRFTYLLKEKIMTIFLPGYRAWNPDFKAPSVGLKFIDHMVGNVGWNEMNQWCEFYAKVMGFAQMVSLMTKIFQLNTLL